MTAPRTLPDRLSRRLAARDGPVNGLHDLLNRRLAWLWWPLDPPRADDRLTRREHALLVVHAAGLVGATAAVVQPDRRARMVVGGIALAAVTWLVFGGAWDRRADAQVPDERFRDDR